MITVVIQIEARTATVQLIGSEKPCDVPMSLEAYARVMLSASLLGTTSPEQWRMTSMLQKGLTTQFFFDIPIPDPEPAETT